MTPLKEAAPRAINPRHLTTETREYETTIYSHFAIVALNCRQKSAVLAAIILIDRDSNSPQLHHAHAAALVDKLLEEVMDAPEPIDRVARATKAVAAAPAL